MLYDATDYTPYHDPDENTGRTGFRITPSHNYEIHADITLCRTFETIKPGQWLSSNFTGFT